MYLLAISRFDWFYYNVTYRAKKFKWHQERVYGKTNKRWKKTNRKINGQNATARTKSKCV